MPTLLPQHLADLHASGLTDDTIAACGYFSESDPEAIGKLLNWKSPAKSLGPCLCIPFVNPANGKFVKYTRLKPDKPRKQKGRDKPNKYESPVGYSNYPYFPPAALPAITGTGTGSGADASSLSPAPLFITEGEKKAARASQDGFPCIGLVGVYGFQKKKAKGVAGDGPRMLLDDLAAITWSGRPVYIVYDSDAAQNSKVLMAEWHLAETLKAAGADVRAVRLPSAADGGKLGFDDYLVAHGADAFRALLASATAPTRPPDDGLNELPDDPHRLAESFLRVNSDGHELHLHSHRDEFYRWDGAHRILPDGDLRGELAEWIRTEFVRLHKIEMQQWRENRSEGKPPTVRVVTTALIANVLLAMRGLCQIPAAINAPAWINEECVDGARPDPGSILPVKNGLLNLDALAAGKKNCLLPATPYFFSQTVLPFEFDPAAPPPTAWLAFLKSIWPNDPENIACLQEWFGYLLTPDTRQQKILFMVGPRRSGKGTIIRVLQSLLGELNFASPTLGSLAGQFGLAPLVGKSVAVVSDARLSGRTDTAVIIERLLSISGEDVQDIDRKHKTAFSTKLPTRFVILSNEIPRLKDSSCALPGRLIILQFMESWYGREDSGLTNRLLEELPGVLLWAIEGWKRLKARGRLQQPASGSDLIEDMEDLSSPIGAFLRDCCVVGKGESVESAELFSAWKSWCDDQGRKEYGTMETFGRDLRAVSPLISRTRRRIQSETSSKRTYLYKGARLKSESELDAVPSAVPSASLVGQSTQVLTQHDAVLDVPSVPSYSHLPPPTHARTHAHARTQDANFHVKTGDAGDAAADATILAAQATTHDLDQLGPAGDGLGTADSDLADVEVFE